MRTFKIDLDISGDGDFEHLCLDTFEISTNFKPFANLKILELIESYILANQGFSITRRHLDTDNEFIIRFSLSNLTVIDTGIRLYKEISTLNEEITSHFPYEFYLDKLNITYILYDFG